MTNGDEALRSFLQRMAGYALTGDVSQHVLFFLYGTGRNGKGVFLNTLARVLGDYAIAAAMETFTQQKYAQHPTELAMLRGARLVTAQETEEGRAWAETRIKQLTGGDPITARFMRQDFFTFIPQFTLVIAGNHKPSFRTVDPAIRARVHLIPFTVTIPEDEQDPELPAKLKDEHPAILRWAIGGCLAWRETGLAPPAAVRTATDEHMAQQDILGQWLEECCELAKDAKTPSSLLYRSWSGWADDSGEIIGSQRSFSQALYSRGFAKARMSGGVSAIAGVRLRRPTAAGPKPEPGECRK